MLVQFVERALKTIGVTTNHLDTDGITSEQAIRKFFGNDGEFGGACGSMQ